MASDLATDLSNAFNDYIVDGDITTIAKVLPEFVMHLPAGTETMAEDFLACLSSLSGSEEEQTDSVINANIAFQEQLQNVNTDGEIVRAVVALIKAARSEFPTNRWTEPSVRAVAQSTKGLLSKATYEELSVAALHVAASTAQLVAALPSKNLESLSKEMCIRDRYYTEAQRDVVDESDGSSEEDSDAPLNLDLEDNEDSLSENEPSKKKSKLN